MRAILAFLLLVAVAVPAGAVAAPAAVASCDFALTMWSLDLGCSSPAPQSVLVTWCPSALSCASVTILACGVSVPGGIACSPLP